MRTDKLRINQLSLAAFAWYLDYLAAIDAKDLARYGALLADGCTYQMNNAPPMVGKAAGVGATTRGRPRHWRSWRKW